MSSIILPVIPASLPNGYCYPSDPQQFVNDSAGSVNLDSTGASMVLVQTSVPLNTQRDRLWFNPDTGHTLSYSQANGSWLMIHPEVPGGNARRIYAGDLTSLQTYDGGDNGASGTVSGPMWEQDLTGAGRMPLGVGNLPDVVNGVVAILLGATGGHNELPIIKANLPTDTLAIMTDVIGQAGVTGTGTEPVVGTLYGSDPVSGLGGACDATASALAGRYRTRGQSEPLGTGTAVNSIGPYFGVFFIKRSSQRLGYTT